MVNFELDISPALKSSISEGLTLVNQLKQVAVFIPVLCSFPFLYVMDIRCWLERLAIVYGALYLIQRYRQLVGDPSTALDSKLMALGELSRRSPLNLITLKLVCEDGALIRLDELGQAVAGEEGVRFTLIGVPSSDDEEFLPDTYHFQLSSTDLCTMDDATKRSLEYMSFSTFSNKTEDFVFRSSREPQPYKLVRDSQCAPDLFKIQCCLTKTFLKNPSGSYLKVEDHPGKPETPVSTIFPALLNFMGDSPRTGHSRRRIVHSSDAKASLFRLIYT